MMDSQLILPLLLTLHTQKKTRKTRTNSKQFLGRGYITITYSNEFTGYSAIHVTNKKGRVDCCAVSFSFKIHHSVSRTILSELLYLTPLQA
jgi:hypothetical protein